MRPRPAMLALIVSSALAAPLTGLGPTPGPDRHGDLAHLPEAIGRDIADWRSRLERAPCVKVVSDTDQIWERMGELDESGRPAVARRERFRTHAWMTPDLLWMVVFAYKDGEADTTTPYTQVLWDRKTGVIRERYWFPQYGAYRVRRYEEANPYGPVDANVADCNGCIFATVMCSWLAGGEDLASRSRSVQIMGLTLHPNLAIVPPDPDAPGIWLDILREDLVRDGRSDPDRLYRRNDFALLSRDALGRPEVSQWRTIVLTDQSAGGRRPTQITGIRTFEYTFLNAVPSELLDRTDSFIADVDELITRSPDQGAFVSTDD
ncbi:MAG: hypothetical protein ACIARR_11415 [Phycisphaerales bacterium JB059]